MFLARENGSVGEILIYEDIGDGGWFGGITAKTFSDELKKVADKDDLNIYINSPGGSVFEGISIFNQILRHKAKRKTTYIDGIAASIASVIAMAGSPVKMAANGTFMIHDPWTISAGSADELRKAADVMEGLRDTLLDTYVSRTGGNRDKISKMMSEETWMNAEEAKKNGFVTDIVEAKTFNNSFSLLSKFKATPKKLLEKSKDVRVRVASMGVDVQRFCRASSVDSVAASQSAPNRVNS